MGLNQFINQPISEWMKGNGPESEIVISSRVRLARNVKNFPFPILATDSQAGAVIDEVKKALVHDKMNKISEFELIQLDQLTELQKRVLVEKHLISPNLAQDSRKGAVVLSQDEVISIMINEEDHLRIQCLYPGLQIVQAWKIANQIDDVFEERLDYSFDEKMGYLTSCPTNVGTGIRASVMVHLPALVITGQINRIISAITQVGLTVRGIYGEGSDALGNLFQISNQITLGQSEEEIIESLHGVVMQIIDHEKQARKNLIRDSRVKIEDRVGRSYGILLHSKIIDSKEATQRLSDLRLGIDLGMVTEISPNVFNELMVTTQPGFLQHFYVGEMTPVERDLKRSELIRKRLTQHE